MSQEFTVAVFGSRRPRPGSDAYMLAHELGEGISRRGWTLCNGGYGGTMEAAAQGAKKAGGEVIGVTCNVWGRDGINRFIDREITTEDLYERLRTLADMSNAYIVLPGGTGTVLELLLVWELVNKKFLKDRPIVLLGDGWQGVIDCVSREDPGCVRYVHPAQDAAEAIEIIASRQ